MSEEMSETAQRYLDKHYLANFPSTPEEAVMLPIEDSQTWATLTDTEVAVLRAALPILERLATR